MASLVKLNNITARNSGSPSDYLIVHSNLFNPVVDVVNNLTGNGTAQAGTFTTLSASGAVSFSSTLSVSGTSTLTGVVTFGANPTFAAGKTLDLDSSTATLSSNAATITKYACVITTEALTTAAGASQAFVITLTGVAAGDLAFVQDIGGTNTRYTYQYKAVTTSNTITVTVYNSGPTNALNGTLVFNLWVVKA